MFRLNLKSNPEDSRSLMLNVLVLSEAMNLSAEAALLKICLSSDAVKMATSAGQQAILHFAEGVQDRLCQAHKNISTGFAFSTSSLCSY